MRTRLLVRIVVASAFVLVLASPSAVYASYTSTVTAGIATMFGDAAGDTLIITASGGVFRHNRVLDPGFNSDSDFDTTAGGDQTVSASTGIINIVAGDGNDTIQLGDGIDLRGTIDAGDGIDTLDYAAFTTPVRANLGFSAAGMNGSLSRDEENPPTTAIANGTVSVSNYSRLTRTFDITVQVLGIAQPDVIGFHIHRGPPGVNGPIIIDLPPLGPLTPDGDGFSFTAIGVVVPEQSEAAFLGGATYVNVHTAAFPAGAIRGQVVSQTNLGFQTGAATGTTGITSVESVTGGTGGDSLVGNAEANVITGGSGDDWVLGGFGVDTLNGDAGNDVLMWNQSDGTESIDGGTNSDTLVVNTNDNDDLLTISPNSFHVSLQRTGPLPFTLDIATTETLTINSLGGADTFTVNNLTGVSMTTLNLNGGNGADLFTFNTSAAIGLTYNVRGGGGQDTLQGPEASMTWNVSAENQYNVAGLIAFFHDIEILRGNEDPDTFFVNPFLFRAPPTIVGGAGADTIHYDAKFKFASGDTTPPDGNIISPGGQPLAFSEVETVNIVNPIPLMTINNVTINETAVPPTAIFSVSLSSASGLTVTANFATANQSAVAPGDYTAQSGALTFIPGDLLETISVPIVADALTESTETFIINLTSVTNADPVDTQGLGTITDNTRPTISAIANQVITIDTATTAVPFTVSDAETPLASLTVSAVSDNPAPVAPSGFQFGGANADRTITVTPVSAAFGYARITVSVSDGIQSASTTFLLTVHPTTVQPPTELYVSAMAGGLVTFRFTPSALGPAATGFVLEGGLNPGEVLASIVTGSAAPIFTADVPAGSFYARMHAAIGSDKSGASNEIRIHVNRPVTPSAPDMVRTAVTGNSLLLAWRNTFGGGPPASLVLDVSGDATTQIPLGLTETLSVPTAPGGTYTLSVRALNAGGSSAASSPVTVAFPSACPGDPAAPANFLAYRLGRTVYVVWDPPASGPAASHYVLNVSGSFVGSFTIPARAISGQVGPGSYTLSLRAVNPCGTGPATPAQTVVVP